jgi:hypothetical protein
MPKISRTQFLDSLQNNWANYIDCFNQLPVQEQKLFLNKQGYARLADLLAHIIAWWTDGADWIAQMRGDPNLPLPEYDVDDFNARAIKNAGGLTETDLIQAYQAQLQKMIDLIQGLTDTQLDYENVNTRLYYEIIMHWTEHEIN